MSNVNPKDLPESFVTWPMDVKSASAEAAARKYHDVTIGPDEHYLYADEPNAGDHVYHGFSNPEKKGEGFAGRTLVFELVDGGSVTLYGPFHCGPGGLLKHGIDLTCRHRTRGVIAKAYEHIPLQESKGYFGQRRYKDLVHLDEDWVIGDFNRIEDLAQELADKHGCMMYYHSESDGGSISSRKEPQE